MLRVAAMMDEARFLRRELDRIGTRRGRCVPRELKLGRRRGSPRKRTAGRRVADLAAELGVAAGTILRWSNGGVRAIVPVRVVPDESPARRGTEVAASLYTLVETAKLHAVDPVKYLLGAVRAADRGETLFPRQMPSAA